MLLQEFTEKDKFLSKSWWHHFVFNFLTVFRGGNTENKIYYCVTYFVS